MQVAILMANTDRSAFAARHPRDDAKFQSLLQPLRPTWDFTGFDVTSGEFPPDMRLYDGVIITGSPASVHDADPWIPRLMALIRQVEQRRTPLFGACFGHQAVALALGGTVGANPDGWVLGPVDTVMDGQAHRLNAAHCEQVLALPPRARSLGGTAATPIGGLAIGSHVLTTQYHPEMTPAFMAALIDAFGAKLPDQVVAQAKAALTRPADSRALADRIVAFLQSA